MAKTSSEDVLQKRREVLRARGVPEKFIEALATRNDLSRLSTMSLRLVPIICVIIFYIMLSRNNISDAMNGFGSLVYRNIKPAIISGSNGEVFIFFAVFLFSSIVMLFSIIPIYLATIFTKHSFRPYPAYNGWAECLRREGGLGTLESKFTTLDFEELASSPDEKSFLKAFAKRFTQLKNASIGKGILAILIAALVLFGASCLFGFIASQNYWQVSANTIEIHDFGRIQSYDLRETKFAQVSCVNASFDYELRHSGQSFRLTHAWDEIDGFNTAQIISRVDLIDSRLQDLGIPIHRMSPTKDNIRQANKCLSYWVTLKNGTDRAVLQRLIYGP